MAKVNDVARYILDSFAAEDPKETLTAWKLQKLVYYAQAWSLVWDKKPLFPEKIEAWVGGPVCRELYLKHRGCLHVKPHDIQGDVSTLNEEERETIDAVLEYYGKWTGKELSDLTHSEEPWLKARKDVPLGERGNARITHKTMQDYYGNLSPSS